MKPVIIIAIAFALLFVPLNAYADVKVSGTTVSGSSDGSIVKIVLSDSDGQVLWKKSVSVDETFEITMPRLEHGKYTLSMKHGAIGGEQEIVEFTYTGPAPIGSFELEIELPDSSAEDFDSFATKNRINNFEKLMNVIRDSDEIERRLEVIILEMQEARSIPSQDLDSVTRFTPDGLETLEYGIAWTTHRAYNDIIGDARQVLQLMEDGMSLDTAINFLGIIPTSEPEPTPDPTAEPSPEQIMCTQQYDPVCGVDGRTYGNQCTLKSNGIELDYSGECKKFEPKTQIDPPSLQLDAGPSVESAKKIPDWVKNIFGWYSQDKVSEDELLEAIKYLITEGILVVD